jgi:hypothetical protein
MKAKTQHTPGPWKIMADPINKGFHEYHDNRWIVSGDAKAEMCEYNENDWSLSKGRLICCLRDGQTAENARLIAAAPELLEALENIMTSAKLNGVKFSDYLTDQAFAAIAKATKDKK